MKKMIFEKTSARQPAYSTAVLGAVHGYRFDGEAVALHAMFAVLDRTAHDRQWALQLWACPEVPDSAAGLSGHLVAQAGLPPIGEIADEVETFEVQVPASYPAGQADYVMVLALVAGNGGHYDELHSLAVYPRRQQFQLPQLRGNVAYQIHPDRVVLTVDSIFNPRCAGNVSGTLAIELWALSSPYAGGDFQGVPLAGATFGQVAGQSESTLREFDLRFTPPSAGTWHYVLMLREWAGAGFVTRDFVNFTQPVTIEAAAAKPEKAEAVSAPVVPAKPAKSKKKAGASSSGKVSINFGTADELAGVKGMPAKVVEGILKARPFSTLEELTKVKGFGAKMLAKVRGYLRL